METEQQIQQAIRLELGQGDVRLWRNNTGRLLDRNGRPVTFGLCPGSSDLIGLRRVRVTPEMVGRWLAVFAAIEVKGPKGRLTREQQQFLEVVTGLGGLGGEARSIEDARGVLRL
ncbi:MAG: VRR-NUC domain-containing protein [Cyanobacteria bacterium J06638_7]